MGTWNNKKCEKCGKPLTNERYNENKGFCGTCKPTVVEKGHKYKEQHTPNSYYDYAKVKCPRCGAELYWITLFYKGTQNSWKALECASCRSNYLNLARVEEVEEELAK